MYEIISCKKYNELGVEEWKKKVKTLTYPISLDDIPSISFYCFDENYGYVRMFDKDRWGYMDKWFPTKKEARLSIEERGLSWIEEV